MRVEFDQSTHTYTLNGRRVPSVTQVLKPLEDFSRVPRDVLEAARIFGQHVHAAVDLCNRGELDWLSLDPALVPYVDAWRTFIADTGAVVIASEMRVVHEKLGYAGTGDVVLAWGKRIVLPDVKSTAVVPVTVGAQTAAYAKAYHSMVGGKEPDRYCIQLGADGKYKLHPRRDPADWSLFLSCLNVHKFKEKHNVAA
jgi:hypothetical protein